MKRWRIKQCSNRTPGEWCLYHTFKHVLSHQIMMLEVNRLSRMFPGHKFRLEQ